MGNGAGCEEELLQRIVKNTAVQEEDLQEYSFSNGGKHTELRWLGHVDTHSLHMIVELFDRARTPSSSCKANSRIWSSGS